MFSIHPGLQRHLMYGILPFAITLVIGLVAFFFCFAPHLEATSDIGGFGRPPHILVFKERAVLFVLGGLLTGLSYLIASSTISWLQRASTMIRGRRPTPVLLTTRLGTRKVWGSPSPAYLASLRPPENTDDLFQPITDVIMITIFSRNTLFPVYTDHPALAYLPRIPTEPLVIIAEGLYWCSEQSNRIYCRRYE